VITRFPAEELLVTAGGQYTVGGTVPGVREVTSNLNSPRLGEHSDESPGGDRLDGN
jgi:hypothetical protein